MSGGSGTRLSAARIEEIEARGYANGLKRLECAVMSDHAARDVPALVAEVRAEASEIARLRTALTDLVGAIDAETSLGVAAFPTIRLHAIVNVLGAARALAESVPTPAKAQK